MPNWDVAEENRVRRVNGLAPLFEFMDARGIKYNWLARRTEISASAMCAYRNGINRPTEDFIVKACDCLGFPRRLLGDIPLAKPRKKRVPPEPPLVVQPRRPASRRLTAHASPTTKPASDGRASRR